MKIIISSENKDKIREIKSYFEDLNIEFLTLNEFNNYPKTIEDGETFYDNALKKAKNIYEFTGILTLADDSGLEVDALNGEPGIYSARFSGENANYQTNNQKLLKLMENIPDNQRGAQFKCVTVLYSDVICKSAEGICRGKIINDYRGSQGFGYDPLFLYEPLGLTFAELSMDEKNKISHRANSLIKMKSIIQSIISKKY